MTTAAGGDEGVDVVEREVTVGLDRGLHARPAARLVDVARSHDCDLAIATSPGDEPVRADSILAVTSLGLEPDDRVRVLGEGSDAETAVGAAAATLEGGPTRE